jgi:hypothetical protein
MFRELPSQGQFEHDNQHRHFRHYQRAQHFQQPNNVNTQRDFYYALYTHKYL